MGRADELYQGELLAVHALCSSRGWVFAEQMKWVCRALRTVDAVMEGQGIDELCAELDEDGLAWFPGEDDAVDTGGAGVGLMEWIQELSRPKEPDMRDRNHNTTRTTPAIGSNPGKAAPLNQTAVVGARELGGASGRGMLHSGTPPMIPGRASKGPSKTEILAIQEHQWIEVPKGAIKFATLKQRVSQANSQAKKDGIDARFVCWENEDDGTMIVRRAES